MESSQSSLSTQSEIEAAQISEVAAQVMRLQVLGHRVSLNISHVGMVSLWHCVDHIVGPAPFRFSADRLHESYFMKDSYRIFDDFCFVSPEEDGIDRPSDVAERWLKYLAQVEQGGLLQVKGAA